MADKFLNLTAVQTIKTWADGKYALDSDLDTLTDRVEEIIAEGGEPNVIEVVKKNGTALPVTNKAVDVEVPTKTSDLTNDGDGTSNFATEDYVDENGGKIDKIKRNGAELTIDPSDKSVNILVTDTPATTSVDGLMSSTDKTKLDGVEAGAEANIIETVKVNGTALTPDESKAVNIDLSAYAEKTDIPVDLSDLTNTSSDPYTKKSEVDAVAVGALKPKGSIAFASLPALTVANLNNMYSISDSFTTTADFVEGAGVSYPAGTNVAIVNNGTDQSSVYKYDAMVGVTDMSAYWTSTSGQNNSLEAATVSEINAILNA